MEEALTEFAQATQLQVLFDSNLVREKPAPVVSGSLTPEAALKQLLADSTLHYEFVNARTVAIRADGGYYAVAARDTSSDIQSFELAQSETAGGGPSNDSQTLPLSDSAPENQASSGIPQVLVKGSRSLNADIERTPDDVRPYIVLDREAIQRSAATDINDLMRKQLNMSSVALPGNRMVPSGLGANTTQIALRGLDSSQTLILVDGRRLTNFKSGVTEQQSDINSIPLSSIERIEVLPATASGIYGGTATGGVVNVVLRRDYQGVETSLTYQNSLESGGAQRRMDIAGGGSLGEKTSYLFVGSYSDADPLLLGQRNFLQGYANRYQEDQIARFPDSYYNAGAPASGATVNVSSLPDVDGAPALTLKGTGQSLGSPITSLPVGYSGTDTASLIRNAGRYNVNFSDSTQADNGAGSALVGGAKMGSLGLTLRRELTPRVKSFLDLFASRNDATFPASSVPSLYLVAADAPNNPFEQDVLVNVPVNLRGYEAKTRVDTFRAVGGVQAEIFRNWSLGADYSFSTTVSEQTSVPSQITSEASDLILFGDIDVFQDPSKYSKQLAGYLVPAQRTDPVHARLNAIAVRAAGPVFSLPAGNAVLSLLTEGRDQHYGEYSSTIYSDTGAATLSRVGAGRFRVESFYSELTLPLASPQWSVAALRSAELQIAGRYDHYRLEGATTITATQLPTSKESFSSVDPSIGLKVEPVRGLTLRGSYGTGYLPPQLSQIQAQPIVRVSGTTRRIRDPKRGNEFVGVIDVLNGGNPGLQPEESRSRSLGAILIPAFMPDFRMSFDWTRIHKKDNITVIPLSQISVNQEDLVPGLITRGAAAPGDPFGVGKITAFDQRNRNVLRAETDSYDMTLAYALRTSDWGTWELSASGTRLVHNLRQTSVSAPTVDQSDTVSYPEWVASAGIRWARGALSLGASARYVGANWVSSNHALVSSIGVDHLPSSTLVDVVADYDIRGFAALGPVSGMKLTLGVKNVFNTPPNSFPPLYDNWGEPMMATYFASVRASLGK